MNILIVHAHHERRSFSSALKDCLVERFTDLSHSVEVSDLYAMKFDPVSDRRNFTTVKRPDYLKQQEEERHANAIGGFAPDIEAEMQKILRADLLVFNFPLWWFGMPAILKGWVDRVITMGRMYGGPLLYEHGIGRGKRGLITMTTGGPRAAFGRWGINPPMTSILSPIQHGIFWFLGFKPLPPFIVYGPTPMTDDERKAKLDELRHYVSTLETVKPFSLPRRADFDSFAHNDRVGRYMVEVRRKHESAAPVAFPARAEAARLAEWQRDGKLLFFSFAASQGPDWLGWLYFRESGREEVEALLRTLPQYDALVFTIRQGEMSGVGEIV